MLQSLFFSVMCMFLSNVLSMYVSDKIDVDKINILKMDPHILNSCDFKRFDLNWVN